MTFILSLGNCDQTIQISDRRLTFDGQIRDEEANKAGVLVCADARLAFGFTGLARLGYFETRQWLLSVLGECGSPDYRAFTTLEEFKRRASRDFKYLPALARVRQSDKRLGIIFSGYLHQHSPPLAAYAVIRNFPEHQPGADNALTWDHFESTYWTERRPLESGEEMTLVQKFGFWPAMNDDDARVLRILLLERRPAKAIIGKAIEMVREFADRRSAQGSIGKQLSSITLNRDLSVAAVSDYHSDVVTHTVYIPDFVVLRPNGRATFSNASLRPVDPANTPPLAIPKLGRSALCWCKSGRKYKRCHGR